MSTIPSWIDEIEKEIGSAALPAERLDLFARTFFDHIHLMESLAFNPRLGLDTLAWMVDATVASGEARTTRGRLMCNLLMHPQLSTELMERHKELIFSEETFIGRVAGQANCPYPKELLSKTSTIIEWWIPSETHSNRQFIYSSFAQSDSFSPEEMQETLAELVAGAQFTEAVGRRTLIRLMANPHLPAKLRCEYADLVPAELRPPLGLSAGLPSWEALEAAKKVDLLEVSADLIRVELDTPDFLSPSGPFAGTPWNYDAVKKRLRDAPYEAVLKVACESHKKHHLIERNLSYRPEINEADVRRVAESQGAASSVLLSAIGRNMFRFPHGNLDGGELHLLVTRQEAPLADRIASLLQCFAVDGSIDERMTEHLFTMMATLQPTEFEAWIADHHPALVGFPAEWVIAAMTERPEPMREFSSF